MFYTKEQEAQIMELTPANRKTVDNWRGKEPLRARANKLPPLPRGEHPGSLWLVVAFTLLVIGGIAVWREYGWL